MNYQIPGFLFHSLPLSLKEILSRENSIDRPWASACETATSSASSVTTAGGQTGEDFQSVTFRLKTEFCCAVMLFEERIIGMVHVKGNEKKMGQIRGNPSHVKSALNRIRK